MPDPYVDGCIDPLGNNINFVDSEARTQIDSLSNSLTQKASISFSAQNVANGKSGITISNEDWHEVSVIVGFGSNPEYQFEFFIPRQFVNTVGTKKFLQGNSDGTDTHTVILEVSTTGVKLISWKFRGTEVTANCPMYIYHR